MPSIRHRAAQRGGAVFDRYSSFGHRDRFMTPGLTASVTVANAVANTFAAPLCVCKHARKNVVMLPRPTQMRGLEIVERDM
jgi:hypothetical protein